MICNVYPLKIYCCVGRLFYRRYHCEYKIYYVTIQYYLYWSVVETKEIVVL